jgi:hypothetical protein
MKGAERKAAIAAYKEQKVVAGIYAVRCLPRAKVWVGSAPNLGTIQNRVWFALRQNASANRALQAAWNEAGADAFSFEIVERLEEEISAYFQAAALKDRLQHWRAALEADLV